MTERLKDQAVPDSADPYKVGKTAKIVEARGLIDAIVVDAYGNKVQVQYPGGRNDICIQTFTRAEMDKFAARAAKVQD